MSDAMIFVLAPIIFSLGLVWLRPLRPIYWWLSLLIYCLAVIVLVFTLGTDWRESVGGFLLYTLPIAAMFFGLRPGLFLRRRYLIVPAGIALYLVGLLLSLSINVSAGLIQP